jgi:hypothetical protein
MRKNDSSADNQQERSIQAGWISGFVDGEGYFGINLCRNKTMKFGWQIQPEFVVTQGINSIESLNFIKSYFGCGYIVINKRKDNHKHDLAYFRVKKLEDLNSKIIPFFKKYPLKTAKIIHFNIFAKIIAKMIKKEHLTHQGLSKICDELGYQLD